MAKTIRRSKYGNRKIKTEDGLTFDSKKEMNRYYALRKMEDKGEIWNLKRQVKYTLLAPQYEMVPVQLKTKVSHKKVCLFRETAYVADFVYIDMKTGERIVEDTKGMKTPEYIIKRKLMLYYHKIKIREV